MPLPVKEADIRDSRLASDMTDPGSTSYELPGPFKSLNKEIQPDQVYSLAVRLRSERNPTHVLNPVGHLRQDFLLSEPRTQCHIRVQPKQ